MTRIDSTATADHPGAMPADAGRAAAVEPRLDVAAVRADFPVLERELNGRPLAYLDNAASAQRPLPVLAAIDRCERYYYANVHRGVHTLSQESTEAYESARGRVAEFLRADSSEIIFTRGTTEALNLVAQSYGRSRLRAGDEVVVTELEHHSNIVPWQLLCDGVGAAIRPVPIDDAGDLLLDRLEQAIGPRTRIVAVSHVSNAIGTINPISRICEIAHRAGAVVVVDGAQSAPHFAVDVSALGCDFFAFSGHKMYAPSGIGVLWGRRELLEAMPPWQSGGGMIERVSFAGTTFREAPFRFEAGTPNIAGAIGLGAAIDYLDRLGIERVQRHEAELLAGARKRLSEVGGLRIVGSPRRQAAVLSFLVDGAHAHDVGTFLDHAGVAVRAGHHCAQPLMERFGVAATTRASFGIYNTMEEVERLAEATAEVVRLFA